MITFAELADRAPALTASITLAACGEEDTAAGGGDSGEAKVLKVGVNPVPHGEILTFVKDELAAEHPYGEWLEQGLVAVDDIEAAALVVLDRFDIQRPVRLLGVRVEFPTAAGRAET